jgi:hypothetical protein
VNDHHDKSPDQPQHDDYARELAELLNLLDTVDSQITPEHIARRFRELLAETEDAQPSAAAPLTGDLGRRAVSIESLLDQPPFLEAACPPPTTAHAAAASAFDPHPAEEVARARAIAHRYVRSARRRAEEMQDNALEKAARIEAEAREKAGRIEAEARSLAGRIEAEAREKTGRIEAEAREKVGRIEAEARSLAGRILDKARGETRQQAAEFLAEARADVGRIADAAGTRNVNLGSEGRTLARRALVDWLADHDMGLAIWAPGNNERSLDFSCIRATTADADHLGDIVSLLGDFGAERPGALARYSTFQRNQLPDLPSKAQADMVAGLWEVDHPAVTDLLTVLSHHEGETRSAPAYGLRLVVAGSFGAGKSALINRLLSELPDNRHPRPAYISKLAAQRAAMALAAQRAAMAAAWREQIQSGESYEAALRDYLIAKELPNGESSDDADSQGKAKDDTSESKKALQARPKSSSQQTSQASKTGRLCTLLRWGIPLAAAAVAALWAAIHSGPAATMITASEILTLGMLAGTAAIVIHGIRQEERRFQEQRLFLKEHGTWHDRDYFPVGEAADRAASAARCLYGLHIQTSPGPNTGWHLNPASTDTGETAAAALRPDERLTDPLRGDSLPTG